VDGLVKLCHEGPAGSSVKKVEVDEKEPEGKYEDFKFRYQ